MLVFESVLDSVLPRFSALDSESALDSVISALLRFCIFPFLKVAFSRIFSRFCALFCFFAKRGVIPSPHSQSPEKAAAVFAALCLQAFGTANGERASLYPLLPLLAQSLRRHSCLLAPTIAHHEAGEGWLVLSHLHIDLIFAPQKWQNLSS